MMAENEQPQQSEPQAQQGDQKDAQQQPKIIVDDDWKAQARAEKEKLAKEVEQKAQAAGASPAGAAMGGRQLPKASFSTHVNSLMAQAFLALGGMADSQGRRYVDLDLAKYHIDTLAVLEEKTRGNLTEDEKKLLDQALYECRMQYVDIAQRIASAPPPDGAPRRG
ncbi:MAG: DUF1844 domain-containing protein [Planctomycetes bacterium]|nr:DUF1844 domain-containing protein [Planctomycetota bacterium]